MLFHTSRAGGSSRSGPLASGQYRVLLAHIRIVAALLALLVVIQLLGVIAAVMFY